MWAWLLWWLTTVPTQPTMALYVMIITIPHTTQTFTIIHMMVTIAKNPFGAHAWALHQTSFVADVAEQATKHPNAGLTTQACQTGPSFSSGTTGISSSPRLGRDCAYGSMSRETAHYHDPFPTLSPI